MADSLPPGAIVVGIDGSTPSDRALSWAARQASLEKLPLVLLHALPTPTAGATPYLHTELLDHLRVDATELLDTACRQARADEPITDVHPVLQQTDPRNALLHASARASMLVVGDRGLGPVGQLLLGSVSDAMVKHSASPVVVIRSGPEHSRAAGVVAAVTGDGRDDAVLDFAFRVAHARTLPVTLVHCFWDAVGALEGVREVAGDEPGYEDKRALLDEAAKGPSARYPSVPVHQMLSRGFVDVQLIAASRRAELLVLGHQRKRFFQELAYGSVAPRVVEHAHSSVAVVPLSKESEAPDPTGSE